MRGWVAIFSAVLLGLSATACSDADEAPNSPSGPAIDTVNQLMKAYNAHDPAAMAAFFHEDVVWYEVFGGSITPVTSSARELQSELEKYFATFPNVSSSLENPTVSGNYVTAVEHPVWEVDGQRKSQSSIVVYEVIDGKVKRFWYFPSQ